MSMSVLALVAKEIAHRKINALLGIVSVTAAVGVLVAELAMLASHDIRTEQILAVKAEETSKQISRKAKILRIIKNLLFIICLTWTYILKFYQILFKTLFSHFRVREKFAV